MSEVAFVLKGYPRLSETFISQEIRALEELGLAIRIYSLRHPSDTRRHPVHDEIQAPITYLPEYLYQEPGRVLLAWRKTRRSVGYRRARTVWLQDLVRDPSANRIRRFGQALVLAAELPNSVRRLHAHFLHTPASVTRYAAMILELPWSVSAHARDIWTSPDWEKREKLADCRWAVTCTAANVDHLRTLAPESKRISLAYHGLDLTRFPPRQTPFSEFDGSQSDRHVRILSVGRAVEKKGYDDLLESFSRLPKTLYWRFTHVGGGPLLKQLKRRSRELGLEERVSWMGALSQNEVLSCYREADVFVLASRIAGDGDRDGLPNVLMEAQTQSLPCVATCISAIPELIEDGVNGLLVSPEDPDSLADALRALISTPSLRHCLGECADRRVRERFSLDAGIELLAAKFEIPVTNISK